MIYGEEILLHRVRISKIGRMFVCVGGAILEYWHGGSTIDGYVDLVVVGLHAPS